MDISKAVSSTALQNPAAEGAKNTPGGANGAERRFSEVFQQGGSQPGAAAHQPSAAQPPFAAPILDADIKASGVRRQPSNPVQQVERRQSVQMTGERGGNPAVDPAQNGANATWQKLATDTQKAESRMDAMIAAARNGKSFSASELLALQVEVFRYSQTVEVISRSTDKLVGAVKQTLGTQV
jgi:hypothetical protein